MVTVRDVMTEAPKSVLESDNLVHVARVMRDEDVGSVPVVDDAGRLVGMLTDRDLVVEAMVERPHEINTLLGNAGAVAHTVAPKLAFRVLNMAYHVFPDSAAAKGEGSIRPTQAHSGNCRGVTFCQLFPPSRVRWTSPSSLPAQMRSFCAGDSAMAKTVS